MRFLIVFSEVILPVLYLGTILFYASAFFQNIKFSEKYKTQLLIITLLVHTLYIISRTLEYNHLPITTVFEIFSLLAYTIGLVYIYIEAKTKIRSTGYFILILPFIFQFISSLFIKELVEIPAILRSNLLGSHVSSALLGYAALTISAVYSFLFLMLYHEIKSKHFGLIYKRLPNLEMLERMSYIAIIFGFWLLTIAIVIGFIWLPKAIDNYSYAEPKLWGTIAIWLIYATGIIAKKLIGWKGRQIMILSLVGFTVTLFSMTIINIFFSGFHKFY